MKRRTCNPCILSNSLTYCGDALSTIGVESGDKYADVLSKIDTTLSDISTVSFITLTDTPSSYTGEGGKILAVNSSGNAVEFVDMAFIEDAPTDGQIYGRKSSNWEPIETNIIEYDLGQEQKDFVQIANNSKANYNELWYRKVNVNQLDVIMRISETKYNLWSVLKDINDNFWKLGKCAIVEKGSVNGMTARVSTPLDKVNELGSGNNLHTTTVGDKIYKTFTGTKVSLRHYKDTRGGIWKFTLNGDESTAVTVSTYSAAATIATTVIYPSLTQGTYYLEGEFMGDDPLNTPTATARGWFYHDTIENSTNNNTFIIEGDMFSPINEVIVLANTSNKEMAFSVRKSGSSNAFQWIPDHGVHGTVFGTVSIKVDGMDFVNDMLPSMLGFFPCKCASVSNDMKGKNTLDNIDLMDIKTEIFFNSKTVEINCFFEMLENVEFQNGYVNMIPVSISSFGKLMVDSRMHSYDLSKTSGQTYFPYKENLKSVVIIDDNRNEFLSATFNGNLDTFLKGRTNYRNFNGFQTRFWIEHRDATLNKFYPTTYWNQTIDSGFVHQTQMTLSMGVISNVFDKFKKPIVEN